jgi:predicted signal transduction protein with EAL and GGDEF domain
MKRADLAMYEAKASGRNALRFFDPRMQAVVTARADIEKDLRAAVGRQSFFLAYQPQVDASGQVIGAEALLRWQHQQRGTVSPAEFIPVAEETGLILPLGLWVLETACAQAALWAARPGRERFTVSVNVSARQFRQRTSSTRCWPSSPEPARTRAISSWSSPRACCSTMSRTSSPR